MTSMLAIQSALGQETTANDVRLPSVSDPFRLIIAVGRVLTVMVLS
jgi:hypothetical protein